VALAAGGCATGSAKAQSDSPSLEVPAPPPRVIVPPSPDVEQAADAASATEPAETPPTAAGRRGATGGTRPKTDPARTEKKVETPPVVETVTPPPVVAPPSATLKQELPAAQAEELKRRVTDQLTQARKDLGNVKYQDLKSDAKLQYDTANAFIAQAEQAMKEGNLVIAARVAEKAAGLAASLNGR